MFFKSKKSAVAQAIPEVSAVPSARAAPASSQEVAPPASTPPPPSRSPSPPPSASAGSTSGPPTSATPTSPATADELRKGAMLSKRIEAALGEIVAVLMRSEAHQTMTLGDVRKFVLPGILLGQFSIAEAQSKANGMTTPVGFVLWANVSKEVDVRLSDMTSGALNISATDWNSGDIPWVMIAAGDQNLVSAILDTLMKQTWAGKDVKMRIKGGDGKVALSVLRPKVSV